MKWETCLIEHRTSLTIPDQLGCYPITYHEYCTDRLFCSGFLKLVSASPDDISAPISPGIYPTNTKSIAFHFICKFNTNQITPSLMNPFSVHSFLPILRNFQDVIGDSEHDKIEAIAIAWTPTKPKSVSNLTTFNFPKWYVCVSAVGPCIVCY